MLHVAAVKHVVGHMFSFSKPVHLQIGRVPLSTAAAQNYFIYPELWLQTAQ